MTEDHHINLLSKKTMYLPLPEFEPMSSVLPTRPVLQSYENEKENEQVYYKINFNFHKVATLGRIIIK